MVLFVLRRSGTEELVLTDEDGKPLCILAHDPRGNTASANGFSMATSWYHKQLVIYKNIRNTWTVEIELLKHVAKVPLHPIDAVVDWWAVAKVFFYTLVVIVALIQIAIAAYVVMLFLVWAASMMDQVTAACTDQITKKYDSELCMSKLDDFIRVVIREWFKQFPSIKNETVIIKLLE